MHSHSKSISPGNAPNGPREGKPKPTDATKLDRIAGQTRGEPTKQKARGFHREREPNPRRRGFGLRSGRIETEGIAASLERKQTETGQVVGEGSQQLTSSACPWSWAPRRYSAMAPSYGRGGAGEDEVGLGA